MPHVLRLVNPKRFITTRWLTEPPSNPSLTVSRYKKRIDIVGLNKDLWSSYRKVLFTAHTKPTKKNTLPLFFYILNINRLNFTLFLETAHLNSSSSPNLYRVTSCRGPFSPPSSRITDPRKLLNSILQDPSP
jgi:hypothetical protein